MIQRTATVTSCTPQIAKNSDDRDGWVATGTLERYGFELKWTASKPSPDTAWSISVTNQTIQWQDSDFEEETRDLVLDGDPPWQKDVLAVLSPYPSGR